MYYVQKNCLFQIIHRHFSSIALKKNIKHSDIGILSNSIYFLIIKAQPGTWYKSLVKIYN